MCSNKRHFLPQLNIQTVVTSPSSLSHSSLTAAFTKSVNTSEKSHHQSENVFHLTLFHTVLKTVEFVLIVISTSLRHIAPLLVAEQHPYIHLLFRSSPFPPSLPLSVTSLPLLSILVVRIITHHITIPRTVGIFDQPTSNILFYHLHSSSHLFDHF